MGYQLSPEQFVDYLLERSGLVDFVESQLIGKPAATWTLDDWREINARIRHLSERMWTPSTEYLIDLYQLQKERHKFWESSAQAQTEKWQARCDHWKERAMTAEAAVREQEKRKRGTKRRLVA